MTAQPPAALGHDSKLGSVWGPPARLSAPAAEPWLSSAARLRAALIGLAFALIALAAAGALGLLLSSLLFRHAPGSVL